MTGIYILLGIILFFTFLLSLKANARLEFQDELLLSISVLGIKIKLVPGRDKPVDYNDYAYKKHQKRLEKKRLAELEKAEKKKKKAEAKRKKKEQRKSETAEQKKARRSRPKRSVLDWIDIATSVLSVFFRRFSKRLHVKVARLHVNVATGDAASTAILYGAVIQSVAYLIEILDKVTNVDALKRSDIQVNVDYLSEKTTLDLCFIFSLRVWHLLDILLSVAWRGMKKLSSTAPSQSTQASQNPQYANKK